MTSHDSLNGSRLPLSLAVKISESNKVLSNPGMRCRHSLCWCKQLINSGKGERERERSIWQKGRCSGSRQTLGESKKCEWSCPVAERPGWGLPLIVTSLLISQIWCASPSVYLTQTLPKMSLDDADLADLKRELEASGERSRRIPSRSLSIPTRPRPLQPPQRPPPPGELNFL